MTAHLKSQKMQHAVFNGKLAHLVTMTEKWRRTVRCIFCGKKQLKLQVCSHPQLKILVHGRRLWLLFQAGGFSPEYINSIQMYLQKLCISWRLKFLSGTEVGFLKA